jgi:organic hydroperoxide reductase OsmC/OhrA
MKQFTDQRGHMAQYVASVTWERGEQRFTDNRYSRGHAWRFDGGVEVPASASPHHVRLPFSVEAAVDPEEAFVASLASCHMLCFLYAAAKRGFVVDTYRDDAVGVMGRRDDGREAMTAVTLRPAVTFSGDRRPTDDELASLHHAAHEDCYIAASVLTDVRCEPVFR